MMTTRELQEGREAAAKLVERGVVGVPPVITTDAESAQRRAIQRVCMARLRAERRGQDASKFPPRLRPRRDFPGSWLYPLFEHLSKDHNLTLLESELQEIERIVLKLQQGNNT